MKRYFSHDQERRREGIGEGEAVFVSESIKFHANLVR